VRKRAEATSPSVGVHPGHSSLRADFRDARPRLRVFAHDHSVADRLAVLQNVVEVTRVAIDDDRARRFFTNLTMARWYACGMVAFGCGAFASSFWSRAVILASDAGPSCAVTPPVSRSAAPAMPIPVPPYLPPHGLWRRPQSSETQQPIR